MRCAPLIPSSVVVVLLAACGAPGTPDRAAPAEAAKQTTPTKPATPAGELVTARAAPPDPDAQANISAGIARLEESRALAQAHAAGTLGDRLTVGELLLVDAKAPADTDQAQYFLLDGPPPATPPTFATLRELKRADGSRMPRILLGGEDGGRPAVFPDIKPGTYTACAVLSPPPSAAKQAYLAKLDATYKAEHGDKLDAEALMAVSAKVQTETGYKAETIDWDSQPVRCKQVVVGADAASRVVVIDR